MTTASLPATLGVAPTVRRLSLARFGFAAVWAVSLAVVGADVGVVSAALLVLYPLVDLAAVAIDARSAAGSGSRPVLYTNIAVSAAAAVGIAVALAGGVSDVVGVWGVWAVAAGLTQLVVAARRRSLGGQWAMVASGALSTVAGTAFVLQASSGTASLRSLAGYAALGGLFFLVSALRTRTGRDAVA